jgi:hypothetical protein
MLDISNKKSLIATKGQQDGPITVPCTHVESRENIERDPGVSK